MGISIYHTQIEAHRKKIELVIKLWFSLSLFLNGINGEEEVVGGVN